MSSQTRSRQEAPQHINRPSQSEPAAPSTGILVVSSLEHGSGRRSQLSEHGSASERAEARATKTDTEEVLIADVRGAVTPAQMVERKLRVLLGVGRPAKHLATTSRATKELAEAPKGKRRPFLSGNLDEKLQ